MPYRRRNPRFQKTGSYNDESKPLKNPFQKMPDDTYDIIKHGNVMLNALALGPLNKAFDDGEQAILKLHPELMLQDIRTRLARLDDWEEFASGHSNTIVEEGTVKSVNTFSNWSEFRIKKVDIQYAVIFAGILMGDAGRHINMVSLSVGQKEIGQIHGAMLPVKLNTIFLYPNPFIVLEKHRFVVRFETDFIESTPCTAIPLIFVIVPAGA